MSIFKRLKADNNRQTDRVQPSIVFYHLFSKHRFFANVSVIARAGQEGSKIWLPSALHPFVCIRFKALESWLVYTILYVWSFHVGTASLWPTLTSSSLTRNWMLSGPVIWKVWAILRVASFICKIFKAAILQYDQGWWKAKTFVYYNARFKLHLEPL